MALHITDHLYSHDDAFIPVIGPDIFSIYLLLMLCLYRTSKETSVAPLIRRLNGKAGLTFQSLLALFIVPFRVPP